MSQIRHYTLRALSHSLPQPSRTWNSRNDTASSLAGCSTSSQGGYGGIWGDMGGYGGIWGVAPHRKGGRHWGDMGGSMRARCGGMEGMEGQGGTKA